MTACFLDLISLLTPLLIPPTLGNKAKEVERRSERRIKWNDDDDGLLFITHSALSPKCAS